MNKPIVILLAGGQSKRFWPLRQKNLLPFLGNSLLMYQIDSLRDAGLNDLVVVSNRESVQAIRSFGVTTVTQKGSGMVSALLSVKDLIGKKSILVVIANDVVDQSFFKSVFTRIQQRPNTSFLTVYKPKHYLPMGYVVTTNGKISEIVEKPGKGNEPSSYVNIFSHFHKSGDAFISKLQNAKTGKDDVYEKTLSTLMKEGEIYEPFEYTQQFAYLKFPWHTLLVMNFFLATITKSHIAKSAKIDDSATISGHVWIEEGVRVMEYAKIVGPCYIGRNTIIGNHTMVRASHIGQQCVIGFGSDITRSYIGALCWLHTNYVGDSVLGENVSMGSGVVLANLRLDEEEIHSHVKGEKVASKREKFGAIVGDNVRIGVNSSIMPGVKIGHDSFIGAGVILSRDLQDNHCCYTKQEHNVREHVAKRVTGKKRDKFRKKI